MNNFSWALAVGAIFLGLQGCSDEDATPAASAGGAGGAPGSTLTRTESCATIDKGVNALIDEARKQAASAGAGGSAGDAGSAGSAGDAGPQSYCATYYAGCSDEDVALAAPQYACFAAHSTSTSDEVAKACPGPKLSASCEAALEKLKPPAEKAMCSSYFGCVFDHYHGSPFAWINCVWEWFYAC